MRQYEYLRTRPGIPWDAPREWFRSDEAHEAWQRRAPLHTPRGRTPYKPTRTMREETMRRDGYACVFCHATHPVPLTVDHFVPRAFGGSNHPNNRRTMCQPCNTSHFARFYAPLLPARTAA